MLDLGLGTKIKRVTQSVGRSLMGRKDPLKLHIRRCHVCGAVTERKKNTVERCGNCGKALAPFFFYREEEAPAIAAELFRAPFLGGEYQPLVGLSVLWNPDG